MKREYKDFKIELTEFSVTPVMTTSFGREYEDTTVTKRGGGGSGSEEEF